MSRPRSTRSATARRRTIRLRAVLALLMTVAVLWLGGFVWFLGRTARVPALPAHADGIVALTGGEERVETALRLLAAGRARTLLVSGVGAATNFAVLAQRAGVDPHLAARVTLGRAALSTRGNAAETAAWAHDNAIASLMVVTAGYHMPRALLELARALPEVRLYPVPVTPPALRGDGRTVRLLAGEYAKYLAAALDLTAFGPHARLAPTENGSATSAAALREPAGG